MYKEKTIKIKVGEKEVVSGEIIIPGQQIALLVLAHGAGAGMNHIFMRRLAEQLAGHGIVTLRYNFPYMEAKKKRPDVPAVAQAAVHAAVHVAMHEFERLPLFAGGKSFGGRMTSQFAARHDPDFLKGIIFFGFPLHPAGAPSTERAEHLKDVKMPMLFLQGTHDKLAEANLVEGVCSNLPNSTLRFFEGADHSFKKGKQDLLPGLALLAAEWIDTIVR